MADETAAGAKIIITAVAEGDGTQKTVAGLEKATAATDQLAAANEKLAASQEATRGPAWQPGPMGGEVEAAAATQANAIQSEGLAILAAKKALIEANLAGNDAEVQTLKGEIVIRNQTLQEMRAQTMTQAELNALCAEEEALLQANAAAAAEVGAAEEAHIYGPRMRGLAVLRNFMSQSSAATIGIGVFALYEIYRLYEQHEEQLKKVRAEQLKYNDELLKEADSLNKIRDLGDVENKRAEILEKINQLTIQRATAEGDEWDKLTGQIGDQQTILSQLDNMTAQVMARRDAEEATKQSLRDQIDALDEINRRYDTALRTAQSILETKQKVEEIELGAEISAINRAERDGAVSHQAAESQRESVKNAAEQKKFDEDRNAIQDEINKLKQESADDEVQSMEKSAASAAAKQAELAAAEKLKSLDDESQKANEVAAFARREADKAKEREAEARLNHYGSTGLYPSEIERARIEAEKKRLADEASGTEQNARAAEARARDLAAQLQGASSAEKQTAAAKSNADTLSSDAAEKARKAAKDNAQKIAELQQKLDDLTKIRDATVKAQGGEDADKLDEAQKRDEEEKKQKQKQNEEQAVEHFRSLASGAESSHSIGQLTSLDQTIKSFIQANSGLSQKTIDALQSVDGQLREHEKELRAHEQKIGNLFRYSKYNAP